MVRISVADAANRLGVNVQRVHQRIADGSLAAERVGRQWTVDDADVARVDRRPAGRPLSARSAWAMALVVAGVADPGLTAAERSRARTRTRRLLASAAQLGDHDEETAAQLVAMLRSLLRGRAERRPLRAAPRDLADLRADGRVRLSGASLPSSGLASGDVVEGYVDEDVVDGLVDEFLLARAGHADANVVLHVVDPSARRHRDVEPETWLLLAADLAEHHRPRETARAAEIVRAACATSL